MMASCEMEYLLRKLKVFVLSVSICLFTSATQLNSKYYSVSEFPTINELHSSKISDTFVSSQTQAWDIAAMKLRENYVTTTLANMSIEEKVGQMFIWRVQGSSMTPELSKQLNETKAGGIILMQDNISDNLLAFTKDIRLQNQKLPLFISIDQEGGIVKRIKSDTNPGEKVLGLLGDNDVCTYIRATSTILHQNGINLNFGIVADVAWESDSFMDSRSFGNNADLVSNKTATSVRCTDSVLSTVKHFPGHGRTKLDSHLTTPEVNISYNDWLKSDAKPFIAAINQNVDMVMVGHLDYKKIDDVPASLSRKNVQMARDIGFKGVIITDDLGMLTASHIDAFTALDKAIDAQNDILLYVQTPKSPKELYGHLLNNVINGKVQVSRIDDSVKRILFAKYKMIGE